MYLSKVTLAPSGNVSRLLISLDRNDSYAAHQLLWRLFSEQEKREFLFRQELAPNGLPIFWLVSHVAPTQELPELLVQTKPFQPQLKQGQRLAFRLKANATVYNNTHKKRHDVMMQAKRIAIANNEKPELIQQFMTQAACQWICDEKRLIQWGISLDVVPDIQSYQQHQSTKKSGQKIQFSSIDYQGVLTIQQPEIFLSQYTKGFGRAKSMGCGLMMIRGL